MNILVFTAALLTLSPLASADAGNTVDQLRFIYVGNVETLPSGRSVINGQQECWIVDDARSAQDQKTVKDIMKTVKDIMAFAKDTDCLPGVIFVGSSSRPDQDLEELTAAVNKSENKTTYGLPHYGDEKTEPRLPVLRVERLQDDGTLEVRNPSQPGS